MELHYRIEIDGVAVAHGVIADSLPCTHATPERHNNTRAAERTEGAHGRADQQPREQSRAALQAAVSARVNARAAKDRT